VILRDVLILSGGIYLKKTKGIVPQSNRIGKIAITALAALLIMTIFAYDELILVKEIILYLCTLLLVLSFISYLRHFILSIHIINPKTQ
jgi:hypothetical protein